MAQSNEIAETTPVSAGEVLQGAAIWLRMLAQTGVTQIPLGEILPPAAGQDPAADASPSPRLATIWEQMIQAPSPAEIARPQTVGTASRADSIASRADSVASRAATATPPGTSPSNILGPSNTSGASDAGHGNAAVPHPPTQSQRETTKPGPPTKTGTTPVFKFSEIAGASGPPLAEFPDLADEQRSLELKLLQEEVRTCQKCPELVKSRTKTVFGTGNIRPRLVLMGEAPGSEEDRKGEPMVGPSGQLLDKIIAAMKMERKDVYILNTIKCHPRQNRNPTEAECSNCRPFWERQLELLRPELIVCLGAVASKTLLQTNLPVGALRGSLHDFRGTPVVVTYHPSYLLRTESAKRQTWDDMKIVMKILRIEP